MLRLLNCIVVISPEKREGYSVTLACVIWLYYVPPVIEDTRVLASKANALLLSYPGAVLYTYLELGQLFRIVSYITVSLLITPRYTLFDHMHFRFGGEKSPSPILCRSGRIYLPTTTG
jgi:hypothetical protein